MKTFFQKQSVTMHVVRMFVFTLVSMFVLPDLLAVVHHPELFSHTTVLLAAWFIEQVNQVVNPSVPNL